MSFNPECERLVNDLLPYAQMMLSEHGEFVPFGGTLADDGEIQHVGVETEDDDSPPEELIDLLKEHFQTGAADGQFNATALVYDILVVPPGQEDKQDAIAVALDHRDGFSGVAIFPYTFDATKEVQIGEPFGGPGAGDIFAS
jgi:hypothetical protein